MRIGRLVPFIICLGLLTSTVACSEKENDAPAPADFGVNNDTPDAGDSPGDDAGNNTPGPDADDPGTPDADDPGTPDADDPLDADDPGDPDADDPGDPDADDPGDPDADDPGDPDADNPPGDPGGTCDPFAQDCPDEEGRARQCNPVQGVPTCVNQAPNPKAEDEPCDGGDCGPGLTCINWSDGRGQICTRMCPPGDPVACGEEKTCSAWLQSNENIGICRPRPETCDIYAQDCPDPSDACTFGRDPINNDPIFVCELAGPNSEGRPCSNGNGRCQAGLICIRDNDMLSTCHAICEDDDACQIPDQTCTGRSTTWQVTFCR